MKTIITDGGRSTSSHPKEKRDCTVRALAIAAQISYDAAHAAMKSMGRKDNRGPAGYNGCMARYAGHRAKKRSGTLGKFIEDNPVGRWIIHVRGHAFALIEGVIYDNLTLGPRLRIVGAWRLS